MSGLQVGNQIHRPGPESSDTARSHVTAREHRAAATAAGILYIVGTVAGVLSKVIAYLPLQDADDPLAYAAHHSGAVATGALLVLVMALSLAFIPVVLFRVLRQVDDVLATGYLIIRGAVETTTYVILAISLLVVVPLAETMSAGTGTDSSAGVRLGMLVVDSEGAAAMLSLVFCFGAALFYLLLYRSRLVPRWIAVWGLAGVPLYIAAYVLAMYGVIDANSAGQNLLQVPLGIQEMVLAVWMISRGFRPMVTSTEASTVIV